MKHNSYASSKNKRLKMVGLPISSLLPGDILLHSKFPQKPMQKIISIATGSPYTHASIYLGAGRIGEATPPKVRTIPISRTLKPGACVGVLRTQMVFDQQRADVLNAFVSALISNKARYDLRGVWKLKSLREEFNENSMCIIEENYEKTKGTEYFKSRNYFCSALIVACYSVVGIVGRSAQVAYPPDIFSPADLYKDPTFGWFLGHIHWSNTNPPANDPLANITSWNENMSARWWS